MGISDFFNLFLIIGAVQGIIFIFVTFTLRKKIEKPVLFLNLFVLFLSLNNLQSWLIDKQATAGEVVSNFITFPWYILIVPMFYSFLIHYLEIEKKRNSLIVISIFLFVSAILARFLIIGAVNDETVSISVLESYHLVEDVFALLYSLLLYVASINILRIQKSLYPKILVYDNLKWIKLFLRLGGFVFVFWILAIVLNTFSSTVTTPYSYYPLRLFSSILIYWVAYQAFFRYRLLKDRIKLRHLIQKDKLQSDELSINSFSKTKLTYEAFELYVKENNSYLNPHLSLDNLAEELSVSVSTLSKVVNTRDENFSDFVNTHRVEKAKQFLTDADFANYTIVAIGLECGFNSKSTFYTAFKKITGKTPSEYKKFHNT